MSINNLLRATFVASAICILLLTVLTAQPALAAVSGPTVISPSDGGTLDYSDDITVRVQPVSGASGYLYGFFQGGSMVWENYANERRLSGTEYTVALNTPAHEAIKSGALQIWVRAMVGGAWSDASILNVTLTSPSGGSPQGTGGEIKGYVSCDNNATPTGVRVAASTGESVDAVFVSRSQDGTAANYSAKMQTIKGEYDAAGTAVTVSVSCNGAPAGDKRDSLGPSPSGVWTLNLFHCAAGRCE